MTELEAGGTKVQLQALQTVAKVATAVLSHLDLESALLSVVNATLDLFGGDIGLCGVAYVQPCARYVPRRDE